MGNTLSQQLPSTVAGLDTASDRFHLVWHGPSGWGSYSLVFPKRASTHKGFVPPDDRRQQLFEHARYAFSLLLPEGALVVCEEPLALKNGKTTRLLALAAGAIWAAHLECSVFWVWADVAAWKKEVIGDGNADKVMIQQWVRENIGREYDEPDFYDAAALCRYGEICLGTHTADST